MVYLVFMPTVDLGVWSFTPLSHIFLFIACFVSPYTAFMVYVTTFFSFFIKTGNYFVWLRAASHLFFVVFLVFYIKIKGVKTKKDLAITYTLTALIHTVFEILFVVIGLQVGLQGNSSLFYLLVVLSIGNIVHNTLDYTVALLIFNKTKNVFDKHSAKTIILD